LIFLLDDGPSGSNYHCFFSNSIREAQDDVSKEKKTQRSLKK